MVGRQIFLWPPCEINMHSVKVDTSDFSAINQIYHLGVSVQKIWIKHLHYYDHCLIRKKIKNKAKIETFLLLLCNYRK